MNKKRTKLLEKKDIILIATVLAVAFASMGVWRWINAPEPGDELSPLFAEIISSYGTFVVELDEDRTFTTPMMPNVVFEIKDGYISFAESDCPDQVCVHTGSLNRPGQIAACLPNNILFFIQNRENSGGVDAFVR